MNIILKNGHVIRDVKMLDRNRNPVGLWIWSTKQVSDQILTFKNVSVISSEIAAIEYDDMDDMDDKQLFNNIDDKLPYNFREGKI